MPAHSQVPGQGCFLAGAVAPLGERLVRNEEVRGSTPLGSTSTKRRQDGLLLRFRVALPDEFWGNSSSNPSSSALFFSTIPHSCGERARLVQEILS